MAAPVKPESTTSITYESAAPLSLEEAIERAQRAFALKQYESAVDLYATALELQTEKHGDRAPENADLYFSYGKALLEHAVSQSSVLGKQEAGGEDGEAEADTKKANPAAFFSFTGDAEEGDGLVPGGGEDVAIDLFAQAKAAVEAADAADAAQEEDDDGEGEGEEEEEPEDDFNAAWEVLDLARALFAEQAANDDEIRLKLADTYITLGDVSLETEKFEQAIADYEEGLKLKEDLLPGSSRQLAEAHYKLGLVLDLTSGRLADAITHIRRALDCTDARLSELRQGLPNAPATAPEPVTKEDAKGKGKATGKKLVRDPVSGMSKGQVEAEIKELEEVINELKLKLDELASPNDEDPSATASAPQLVARELDAALNAPDRSASSARTNAPVNDLTGMVKKKKKDPAANGLAAPEKRKAEDDGVSPIEKKAKLDGEAPAS